MEPNQLEELELAKETKMPFNELLVIEYPGYIKNNDNALETLGGIKRISEIAMEKPKTDMELRYNPKDFMCNPLLGQIINTNNLVFKLTRKVKKYSDGRVEEFDSKEPWKVVIVGIVKKTVRFRGLSDIQYSLDQNDQIVNFLNASDILKPSRVVSDTVDEIRNSYNEKIIFPTPTLYRVTFPLHYNYKQHFLVKEKIVQKNGKNVPVTSYPKSTAKYNYKIIRVGFDAATVPTKPLTKFDGFFVNKAKVINDIIEKKFQEKPIWSRTQLEKILPDSVRNFKFAIRMSLSCFAYYIDSGPWRDLWVKFGYDPRISPKYFLYQQINIRNYFLDVNGADNKQNENQESENPGHEIGSKVDQKDSDNEEKDLDSEDDLEMDVDYGGDNEGDDGDGTRDGDGDSESGEENIKMNKAGIIGANPDSVNGSAKASKKPKSKFPKLDKIRNMGYEKDNLNSKNFNFLGKKHETPLGDLYEKIYEKYGIRYGNCLLQDIKLKRVQKLVALPNILQETCTKESGWLKPHVFNYIKIVVKNSLIHLIKSKSIWEKSKHISFQTNLATPLVKNFQKQATSVTALEHELGQLDFDPEIDQDDDTDIDEGFVDQLVNNQVFEL